MRNLILLTLAGVIWIGSGPRPASAACGQHKESKEIIALPSYTALIQGVLEELPLMRCPRPAAWMLHAGRRQFYVDFGTNAELLAKARKLHKLRVEVGGTLEDTGHYEEIPNPNYRSGLDIGPIRSRVRILHVTSLTALGDPEGTDVEISGELHVAVLESYPPIIRWTFRADNANYSLRFNSATLMEKAWNLKGQSLTVIGKLEKDSTIIVTGLVQRQSPHIRLPGFPEEVPPYIFKPVITK